MYCNTRLKYKNSVVDQYKWCFILIDSVSFLVSLVNIVYLSVAFLKVAKIWDKGWRDNEYSRDYD